MATRHGRLTEEYGTNDKDCDAVSLLEKLCNAKSVQVMNPPEHIKPSTRGKKST